MARGEFKYTPNQFQQGINNLATGAAPTPMWLQVNFPSVIKYIEDMRSQGRLGKGGKLLAPGTGNAPEYARAFGMTTDAFTPNQSTNQNNSQSTVMDRSSSSIQPTTNETPILGQPSGNAISKPYTPTFYDIYQNKVKNENPYGSY